MKLYMLSFSLMRRKVEGGALLLLFSRYHFEVVRD
jgi:hypothetical protein